MAQKRKEQKTYQQLWDEAPMNKRQVVVNYLNTLNNEVRELPLSNTDKNKLFSSAERVAMEYLDPEFDTKYKAEYDKDDGTQLDWRNHLSAVNGATGDVHLNAARRIFTQSHNKYNTVPLAQAKYFTYNPDYGFVNYDYSGEGKQFDQVYQAMPLEDRGKYIAKTLLGAISRFTDLENPETYTIQGINLNELPTLQRAKGTLESLSRHFTANDVQRLRTIAAQMHFDLDKFDRLFGSNQVVAGSSPAGSKVSGSGEGASAQVPRVEQTVPFQLPGYQLTPNADGRSFTVRSTDNSVALPGGIFYDDVTSPYYGKAYFTDESGKLYYGNIEDIEGMKGQKPDGSEYQLAHTNTQYMQAYNNYINMLRKRLGEFENGHFKSDAHSYFNPYTMYGGMPDFVGQTAIDFSPYLDENGGYHYMDISDLIEGDDQYFMLLPKTYDPSVQPWANLTKNPIFKYSYTETPNGGRNGSADRVINPLQFNFNNTEQLKSYGTIINPGEWNLDAIAHEKGVLPYMTSVLNEIKVKKSYDDKAQALYNSLKELDKKETNNPKVWYEKVARAIYLYQLLSSEAQVNYDINSKGRTRKAAYQLITKVLSDYDTYKMNHGITSNKQGGILKFQTGAFEDWAKQFENAETEPKKSNPTVTEVIDKEKTKLKSNPYDTMRADELEWRLENPFKGDHFSVEDGVELVGAITELASYTTALASHNPLVDAGASIGAMGSIFTQTAARRSRGEDVSTLDNIPKYLTAAISGIGPVAAAKAVNVLRFLLKAPFFKFLARMTPYTVAIGGLSNEILNPASDARNLINIANSEGIDAVFTTRSGLQSIKNLAISIPALFSMFKNTGVFTRKFEKAVKLTPGEVVDVVIPGQNNTATKVALTSDQLREVLIAGRGADDATAIAKQSEIINRIVKETNPRAANVQLVTPISKRWAGVGYKPKGAVQRVILYDPEAMSTLQNQNNWWTKNRADLFLYDVAKGKRVKMGNQHIPQETTPIQARTSSNIGNPQGYLGNPLGDEIPSNKTGNKLERLKKAAKGMKILKGAGGLDLDVYSRLGFDDNAYNAYSEWVKGFEKYPDQERGDLLKDNKIGKANNKEMYSYLWRDYLSDYQLAGLDIKDAKTAYKEWKQANPAGTPEQFKDWYDGIVDEITNYKKQNWGLTQGYVDPADEKEHEASTTSPLGKFAANHHTIYRSFNQGYDPAKGAEYGSANALRVANVRNGNERSAIADLIDDLQEGETQKKFYIDADGHIQFIDPANVTETLQGGEPGGNPGGSDNPGGNPGGEPGPGQIGEDIEGMYNPNITGLPRSPHVPLNEIGTVANYLLSRAGNRAIREGKMRHKVNLLEPKRHIRRTGSDYLAQSLLTKQQGQANWQAKEQIDNYADLGATHKVMDSLRQYIDKINDKKAEIKSTKIQSDMEKNIAVEDFNNDQSVDARNENIAKLTNLENYKNDAIVENAIRNISDTQLLNKTRVEQRSKEALDRREDENDRIEAIVQDKIAYGKSRLLAEYKQKTNVENSQAYQNYRARMIEQLQAAGVSPSQLRDPNFVEAYLRRSGNTFEESPEYIQYEKQARLAYAELERGMELLNLRVQSLRNRYRRTARGKWLWRDYNGEFWGLDRLDLSNSNLVAPRTVSANSTEAPTITRAKRGTKLGDRYLRLLALNEKKRQHEDKKALEENKQHDKRVAATLNELNRRDRMLIQRILK